MKSSSFDAAYTRRAGRSSRQIGADQTGMITACSLSLYGVKGTVSGPSPFDQRRSTPSTQVTQAPPIVTRHQPDGGRLSAPQRRHDERRADLRQSGASVWGDEI